MTVEQRSFPFFFLHNRLNVYEIIRKEAICSIELPDSVGDKKIRIESGYKWYKHKISGCIYTLKIGFMQR